MPLVVRSSPAANTWVNSMGDGSAATPSLTFSNNATMGIYKSASSMGFASQGADAMTLSANSTLTVLGQLTVANIAAGPSEIPSSQKLQAIAASRGEEDDAIILREDPAILELINAELWTSFRKERDALLLKSDWTMLPDVSLDTKDAWIEYRAALRALPALTTDPAAPNWPVAPA